MLTTEERTSPQWDLLKDLASEAFFWQRRQLELTQHDGSIIVPTQKKKKPRRTRQVAATTAGADAARTLPFILDNIR
jgi:hypothetical protein